MVRTITGGLTTSGGEGAKELAGEALGLSDKKLEEEVKLTGEEDSMQKKIVKLIAEGKADKDIRNIVGCSDAQLQVIKMYLGDIIDKARVEAEKVVIVEEKTEEEGEAEETPGKVWDPFETKGEKKKKEVKKVKLVPTIWDPLSPDKPRFVEVPVEEEPVPEVIAEEAVEKTKIEEERGEGISTKKEMIIKLLEEGRLSIKEIAEESGASVSYVRKIKTNL